MSQFIHASVLWLVLLPATSHVFSAETQNASFYLHDGVSAIEKALDEPIEIEFKNTPLLEVVKYLEQQCKIDIAIDACALKQEGHAIDMKISASIHSPSLRMALYELLHPHDLMWSFQDGTLLITTSTQAEVQMIIKMYDVSDLVVCRDEKGVLWDDYDTLRNVIMSTVKPTTWEEVGGPASIGGASLGKTKILFISQGFAAQQEVAKLIEKIRKIAENHNDAQPPLRNRPSYKQKAECGAIGGMMQPTTCGPVEHIK